MGAIHSKQTGARVELGTLGARDGRYGESAGVVREPVDLFSADHLGQPQPSR